METLAAELQTKLTLNGSTSPSPITEVNDSEIVITHDQTTKQKVINGFRVQEEIGKGSWSKVKLCVHLASNTKYAIKKFHKGILKKKTKISRNEAGEVFYKSQWDNVEAEISVQRELNHPNITIINSILKHDSRSKLFLIIDYCEHGDFLKWNEKILRFKFIPPIEALSPTLALRALQRIAIDSVEALRYLHENEVIHRDVKPQNILVTSDLRAKICDFGLAVKLKSPNQLMKGTEGTYHFMAPESLSDSDNKDGFDGKKADVWSLGVTFYCMAFLRLPFYHDNLMQLFQMIQSKEPKYESPSLDCEDLLDLIKLMLIKDPKKRPAFSELVSHRFFTQNIQ